MTKEYKQEDIKFIVNRFIGKIQSTKNELKIKKKIILQNDMKMVFPDKTIALVIKNFGQYCTFMRIEKNKINNDNYLRLIQELKTYSHYNNDRGLIINPHVEDYGVVIKQNNHIVVSISGNEFDFIYSSQRWAQDPKTKNLPPITKSLSSEGSDITKCKKTINFITNIVEEYKINTIIDLACGDMTYMRETLYNIRKTKNIEYYGLDVSAVNLQNIYEQYCGNSITQFTVDKKKHYTNHYVNDISTEYKITEDNGFSRNVRCIEEKDLKNIREGSMLNIEDLSKLQKQTNNQNLSIIIVREVFQHIHIDDVNTALSNILKVFNNCYFLATNYINNSDYCNGFMTLTGGTQIRNLSLLPTEPQLPLTRNFDDQYPLELYPRKPNEPGYHYMSLWFIKDGVFNSVN